MNTLLFIEPRQISNIVDILNEYYKILGNWNYVFYCGKGTKTFWENADFVNDLKKIIEIRELPVSNLTSSEYNNLLKTKDIWESLKGDFVMTAQVDTWPVNIYPHTIDYFINLNKSYIGGNMFIPWDEMNREKITFQYMNFNGGLSLRKRLDMLKVIDSFPPEPTVANSEKLETDAEDVYFSLGCYKLKLPIGNDENSSHFAIHGFSKQTFFGIHNPHNECAYTINNKYPHFKNINPWLKLQNAYFIPGLDD